VRGEGTEDDGGLFLGQDDGGLRLEEGIGCVDEETEEEEVERGKEGSVMRRWLVECLRTGGGGRGVSLVSHNRLSCLLCHSLLDVVHVRELVFSEYVLTGGLGVDGGVAEVSLECGTVAMQGWSQELGQDQTVLRVWLRRLLSVSWNMHAVVREKRILAKDGCRRRMGFAIPAAPRGWGLAVAGCRWGFRRRWGLCRPDRPMSTDHFAPLVRLSKPQRLIDQGPDLGFPAGVQQIKGLFLSNIVTSPPFFATSLMRLLCLPPENGISVSFSGQDHHIISNCMVQTEREFLSGKPTIILSPGNPIEQWHTCMLWLISSQPCEPIVNLCSAHNTELCRASPQRTSANRRQGAVVWSCLD